MVKLKRNPSQQPLIFLLVVLNLAQLGFHFSSSYLHHHGLLWSDTPTKPPTPPHHLQCESRPVNATLATQWGCKVVTSACLDHGRVILHSGQKTPGHASWTNDPIVDIKLGGLLLPGYDEPLGSTMFIPCSGKEPCTLDVRAPTPLDPPDVATPTTFDSCRVPLIFNSPYFSNFAEFYLGVVMASFHMHNKTLVDNRTVFTPYTGGMTPPPFYQNLLEPFSPSHKVESLDEISSRENVGKGRPRCFEKLLVCNLVGLYKNTLQNPTGIGYGYWHLSVKQTGRAIVDYYEKQHPKLFHPADPETFQVLIVVRNTWRKMLNLEEVLAACKAWKQPAGSPYKKVKCLTTPATEKTFVQDIAELQRTKALVVAHGAASALGFFLPAGSAVIEMSAWDFCGYWSRQYYEERMEMDKSVETGFFRISADEEHNRPGPFEVQKIGSPVAWNRDRNFIVDFAALEKAIIKIALGDIATDPLNRRDRFIPMNKFKKCPYETERQFPGWKDPEDIVEIEEDEQSEVEKEEIKEEEAEVEPQRGAVAEGAKKSGAAVGKQKGKDKDLDAVR